MSQPPDVSESTAPKDPAAYRPKPLLGVSFWAMIALAVICVLAGVAIAELAPRLGRPKPAPAAPAPDSALSAAPTAAITALPPPMAPAEPVVASADLERLDARLDALESQEGRTSQAAAAALAAAAVMEAAQGSQPFAQELATLRAVTPPTPELAALTRLAETGAPSRAALAASFPNSAARAAAAARSPGDGAGLGDRIAYAVSRIVTVRRVGEVDGRGPDAQLARAELLVDAST